MPPEPILRGHRAECSWNEIAECNCDNPYIVNGKFVNEIPEPEPRKYEDPLEHKDEESKLKRAMFQVIQADERADKWGRECAILRSRIQKAIAACKEKDLYGKDINPAKIIHILEGDKDPEPYRKNPYGREHLGSCKENGHEPKECPNFKENRP